MDLKSGKARETLGLLGFLVLSTAQVSNMILARGVAGSVPPFSIAFFRWSIVAIGLSPLIVAALRQQPGLLREEGLGIAAAGFLGMFVCGGPVYLAGTTTSAINLALIMALSPLMVLLFSLVMGLETVNRWHIIGMAIALSGAVLVITRGQTSGEHGLTQGDILVLCAMLGWAGYTLVQNRIGAGVSFLARIGLFAAFGALFSLPFALHETWSDPSAVFSFKAAKVYLFAGLVPGLRRLSPDAPRAIARRFTVIAWPAFAVLVGTGIWNIVALHVSWDSDQGTTLVVKLAVVAVSGVTAFVHSRVRSRPLLAAFGALTALSALGALFLGIVLAG